MERDRQLWIQLLWRRLRRRIPQVALFLDLGDLKISFVPLARS